MTSIAQIRPDAKPDSTRESLPAYAELHCLTNFSFQRGASHPQELVERAHALGYAALAITDECSLAGVVRAHLAARETGLKLLIGSEFTLDDGLKLVLLATDRAAYGDLSELITHGRRNAEKGSYRLTRDDVAAHARRCLALWLPPSPLPIPAGAHGESPSPPPFPPGRTKIMCARSAARMSTGHSRKPRLTSRRERGSKGRNEGTGQMPATALSIYEEACSQLEWLREIFPDRLWIAVELLRNGRDNARLAALRALGTRFGVPLVAAGDVQMHKRDRKRLHDVLTAIRLGTTVQAAGYALVSNGERCLCPLAAFARIYPPELLAETVRIAERCTFSLEELRYEYPEELVPAGETPTSYLRKLTEEGIHWRWPSGIRPDIRELVERELALIAELNYEPFFLTVYDIVQFARTRNIYCQGRGSAANSVVCYCLGITEVDPARIQTLFERFVSKERNEPPDIDVDFEHERREEVIQYVYDKYGRDRAALAATVITYRTRSAVRDVGKALGLTLDQVDRLAKKFQWWDDGKIVPDRVREAGFDPGNPVILRVAELAYAILGFPRHLSQHVGGFVIARDKLSRLVPVENAAMAERTVIQWDKDDLDALGLLKVDCLGLGMLTVIHKAFDSLERAHGKRFAMADIPPGDSAVYDMICNADTVGVFQIESRAQMSMLPRLKPRCFYDLVIEIAIVRPGPIQGNMVHPYLRRRNGEEDVDYPSDEVEAVLKRTLGVPIFQEQVIKLAMVAAGFTPGEADGLRRAMAAWKRKGGLEPYEQRLIAGMRARGYTEDYARRIFQQIQGFGEYGFPESHSASFALLAYVSAWLKYHEPAAFLCALLNSQPMGFYAPSQLVQDARRHGVEVRAVDVQVSEWDCTLESSAVRLGLRLVKGLTKKGGARIVAARAQAAFASVTDLARRAHLGRRDIEALAAADALAKLSGHRHRARWSVAGVEPGLPLLDQTEIAEALPLLRAPTEAQNIVADYASLELTLGRHPLALLRPHLRKRGCLAADEVRAAAHGSRIRTAGLVVCRQHPGSSKGVIFLTLEDEGGCTNVVVWPGLAARQRRELLHARLLGVYGEVQREGEVLHVIAQRMEDHSALLGGLVTRSRDFR